MHRASAEPQIKMKGIWMQKYNTVNVAVYLWTGQLSAELIQVLIQHIIGWPFNTDLTNEAAIDRANIHHTTANWSQVFFTAIRFVIPDEGIEVKDH